MFFVIYKVGALAFERWGPGERECSKKLNVTIKTIQDIPYPAVINNTLLNNFMECAWKKRGFFSDDGKVNWDALKNLLLSKDFIESDPSNKYDTSAEWEGIINGIIASCRDVRGDTHGQTIVKVQNCFLEHGYKYEHKQ